MSLTVAVACLIAAFLKFLIELSLTTYFHLHTYSCSSAVFFFFFFFFFLLPPPPTELHKLRVSVISIKFKKKKRFFQSYCDIIPCHRLFDRSISMYHKEYNKL